MKTTPMEHQKEGERRLLDNPKFYAIGAEQGTGKTWMLLNDAEHQFRSGRINGLFVLAPKGVHTNWVLREIPTHVDVPVRAEYYVSGLGKRRMERINRLLRGPEQAGVLDVLTMNIDAINTPTGRDVARKFLMSHDAMMAIDESSRIKSMKAERTKHAIALGKAAKSRRIMSGTAISNSPLDIFAQFEFLAPGKGLLGTTSERAFIAQHAQLLPPNHPIVREAIEKARARGVRNADPQILARDTVTGRPVYRDLDKLRERIAPFMYRVLKKDCLDLPDKIYKTVYFELEPAQLRVYEQIRDQLRYERDCGQIDKFNALTKLVKLRQVTSGFVMLDGVAMHLATDTPRMKLLREIVQDIEGQFIVWASFREELRQIADNLRADGLRVVEYHGGVNNADREIAVDSFQRGEADVFVGQPQSGGIGLTLTAAETAVYYSNDFSLEQRLQSEDRCHRIGTKSNVVYIDLAAVGTIDETIAAALQAKADVAASVLNGL